MGWHIIPLPGAQGFLHTPPFREVLAPGRPNRGAASPLRSCPFFRGTPPPLRFVNCGPAPLNTSGGLSRASENLSLTGGTVLSHTRFSGATRGFPPPFVGLHGGGPLSTAIIRLVRQPFSSAGPLFSPPPFFCGALTQALWAPHTLRGGGP